MMMVMVVVFSVIVVVVSVPVVVFFMIVVVVVVLGMGVTAFARMFMLVLGDMFFFHSIAEFVSAKIPHPPRNPVANFSTL